MILNGANYAMQVNEQGKQMTEHGGPLFPIACFETDVAASSVCWHWHDDWEIVTAAEGAVLVSICSKKYRLHSGQGIFIQSGVPHGVSGAEDGRAVLRSAVFHPRLLGGFDSIYWQKYIEPLMKNSCLCSILLDGSAPWHREFLAAMKSAWEAVANEAECYEFEVRAALSRSISLLYRQYPVFQSGIPERELRDMERIKIMLQYVQEHYDEELTIAMIADSAVISKSECLRCFHRTLGVTPIQYLKQFRIQRAVNQLLSTDNKVADIAMSCGFSDAAYFVRQFREVKGCTPGEFRKVGKKYPRI